MRTIWRDSSLLVDLVEGFSCCLRSALVGIAAWIRQCEGEQAGFGLGEAAVVQLRLLSVPRMAFNKVQEQW